MLVWFVFFGFFVRLSFVRLFVFPSAFSGRPSSRITGLYTPRGVFDHAVSLRQTFVHCAKFPVAAVRRRMFRHCVYLDCSRDQTISSSRYPYRASTYNGSLFSGLSGTLHMSRYGATIKFRRTIKPSNF